MDNVSVAAAGWYHSLAVKKDGSLWSWGSNNSGELGDGRDQFDNKNPAKIMNDVVSVAATNERSFAIKTDGSLWAWGSNKTFTLGWQFDATGALGDGTNVDRNTPVKIMDDVVYVSASPTHSFAIKNDQSLWAWGDNEFGQLGDGTTEGRETPVKVMDNVSHVAAGRGYSLVVKADDSLLTWGNNSFGQLGDGTTEGRETPVKIMDNVIYVAAGLECSFAVKTDGSLWAWGSNNNNYQLGDGTRANSSFPVKILAGMKLPKGITTGAPLPSKPPSAIRVIYNLDTLVFDQPPIIENNRVLVPLRVIFEALRADVNWNRETQSVTAERDGTIVVLQIGNPVMTIDGESITLDAPPKIMNNRTLIPIRAVAEAFDADVTWDGANRVVTILKDF